MTTPTIPAGNLFMNATLYTGNGSTQTITNGVAGQSFQPDFAWSKNRSNARSHALVNSVVGATSQLQSNTTAAEFTGGFASLNSNGFSVNNSFNENNTSETYVCWQWKAGGAAVTNTSGSISSQVSANTTSGFSVVTYTTPSSGTFTVGHGLGVAPSFIISRIRTIVNNWYCYHVSLGNASEVILNSTAASSATSDWNSTSPTSSVFSMGSGWAGSYSMISYCWTPIAGFSQFGSYTGNGSTDGPFIYTGFRPRWVMTKRTDSASGGNWTIIDSSRNPYNVTDLRLYADTLDADSSSNVVFDFVSNGFKVRQGAGSTNNISGATYIYAAFAENPFKYANAR
jgi:hypothetical protein